jgi:hypothetical protein
MPDNTAFTSSMTFVDDVVVTDFDAVAAGPFARLRIGAHVEPDDRRTRGMGQDDIGFGDAADAAMQDLAGDFVGPQLADAPSIASSDPCTSALMTNGRNRFSPSFRLFKADRAIGATRSPDGSHAACGRDIR